MAPEIQIKRGKESWLLFTIAYGVLLTISIGIIDILPIYWIFKLVLIILAGIFLYWLCFKTKFRNKIVGLKKKSMDKIEKYKS